MIERTQERFGLWPQRLAADTVYGSAENLAWLVHERGIEPHILVIEIPAAGRHVRASRLRLRPYGRRLHLPRRQAAPAAAETHAKPLADEDGMVRYRASQFDC